MQQSKLCGYKLAAKNTWLSWANRPYKGYDRENFLDMDFLVAFGKNPLADDGTEMWRLQKACLDNHAYFTTVEEVRALQRGFTRHGKDLDVLRIRVDLANLTSWATLEFLPEAQEAADAHFEVLGYDIGWLMGVHSIIYQPGVGNEVDQSALARWIPVLKEHGFVIEDAPSRQAGFMDTTDDQTKAYWASRLTKHGLFRTVEDSREFRELFYAQPDHESGSMEILEIAALLDA